MMTWLAVNSLLSIFAGMFLLLNRDCPHRLQFNVCCIALVSWLVPWHYFSGFLGSFLSGESRSALMIFEVNASGLTAGDTITLWQWLLENQVFLLICSSVVGASLFVFTLIRHFLFLHELQQSYKSGNHLWDQSGFRQDAAGTIEIRLQDKVPGAWNSGIINPVIWIHRDLETHPDLSAVLLHETIHIRHRDNLTLSIITFVESLFWWNPLVIFLGKMARDTQELACDEKCAGIFTNYRMMLNNLVLLFSSRDRERHRFSLNTPIFQGKSLHVKRIQALQRRNTMKAKHYLATAFLAIISVTTVGMVSAQEQSDDPAQRVREVQEKRRADPNYEMTTEDILAGMEVYAANLENAWQELKEENEMLRNRLAELQDEVEN